MKRDPGLEVLLDLDGSIIDQGNGYWIKIQARKVESTPNAPHGIRYALTLHDRYGTRILGYDNAHSARPVGKFKFAGRILSYDHKHRHAAEKGVPYEFKSAQELVNDFFADVDHVLMELTKE